MTGSELYRATLDVLTTDTVEQIEQIRQSLGGLEVANENLDAIVTLLVHAAREQATEREAKARVVAELRRLSGLKWASGSASRLAYSNAADLVERGAS